MFEVSAAGWWTVWPRWDCRYALQWRRCPIDRERFVNARAGDYWTLRERLEQGEIDIDPDDDRLAAQLGSIKWGIDSRGRIKIESKGQHAQTRLPSPDRADCAAIAFAAGQMLRR